MDKLEKPNLIRSFAPIIGIFLGYIAGWIIYVYLKDLGVNEVAIRAYTLVFSFVGWSLGIMVQGRKLHGGGINKIDESDAGKYSLFFVSMFIFMILSSIFISGGDVSYSSVPLVLVVAGLFGEIGWGDPFRAIKIVFIQ